MSCNQAFIWNRSNTASRKRVLYSHSNTRTADRFCNYPRLLGSFCIKKSISPRWKLTCVYWGVAFPQRLYYLRLENAIPSAQYYGCPVAAGQLIQSQEQLHRMKRGSRIGFHCSGGNCQMHSNEGSGEEWNQEDYKAERRRRKGRRGIRKGRGKEVGT